ncbi:hypothetical protein B9Z55_012889 [Caenorhabditis nigoni]|uniref:Uncharacterized protein n=1 Tax=Caenorhabditis nigoni TaxID=1611254 RepID=A0A2G5TZH1_9PELO|nr:hypothetical protein B9Z55_012889 [Caenorhabditis nigoni]
MPKKRVSEQKVDARELGFSFGKTPTNEVKYDSRAAGDFQRNEQSEKSRNSNHLPKTKPEEKEKYERRDEYEANEFSRFFGSTPSIKQEDVEELKPAQYEIQEYTHKDAVKFAEKSWEWAEETERQKILESAPDDGLVPSRCMYRVSQTTQGVRAYYRVVAEHEDKYILMACHTNLHGFHRGDLRFVEVNARTVTDGFEKFSIVGKLFLGDLLAVTKLSKKSKKPLEPPEALKMNQDSWMIWEVAEMRVLERQLERITFAFMKNGSAIVKGKNEAATVKFDNNEPFDLESLYTGSAFYPVKIFSKFTEDYHKAYKSKILQLSSRFSSCPNALGTIYKYECSPLLTEKFKIGKDAFKQFDGGDAEFITELCTQMGQSAVLTLSDGRADSRMFPLIDPVKEDNGVKFSIPNSLKYPTEGLWNPSNRIRLEGSHGKIDATIETVILDDRNRTLRIFAYVSQESLRRLNFRDGEFVVYQREAKDAVMLKDGYLRRMRSDQKSLRSVYELGSFLRTIDKYLFSDNNGRKIIETLYGGPSLQKEVLIIDTAPTYIFPSDPPIPLNEYQNQYVSMMTSSRYPMLLGSSPFGCGKSMTIVMAAIQKCKSHESSQQFLITQSNYASVNLIDIARKVKESKMKVMRYVTESNWKELPENCRTPLDLPILIEWTFKQLAHGEYGNRESTTPNEKAIILAYLYNKNKLQYDLLSSPFQSYYMSKMNEIHEIPVDRRSREIFKMFFKFYQPNVIMITADTLQAVLDVSTVFNKVVMIQIDEACQLPECTLISLLRLFPDANYGLIGDIKQLPPFCEDELKGKLKEYGIGNTMERAIEEKMFPEAILRYVYRCHPKTTELLSELFYDGNLITGVEENQRNEFMRRRPDFWPNPHYPIIVVHNRDKAYKIGTSCGNRVERILAKQIVDDLLKERDGFKLEPSDIGVISFYAGQTAVLSDSFRGTGVKCGTVDAFQGSEREVIILCCTNERISEFMQMSNRLNVAMSRARQATIIIGNSIGLSEAKYWKDIIKKAEENGGVVDTTKYPFHVAPAGISSILEDLKIDENSNKTSRRTKNHRK